MSRVLMLFLTLFISSYLFSQHISNIDLPFLLAPVNRKDFDLNKKRFDKKYKIGANYRINCSYCELVGVERDIVSEINYYTFKDEDNIFFTVFEYHTNETDSSGRSREAYNLSLPEMKSFSFRFDVGIPYFIELNSIIAKKSSLHPNYSVSSKKTPSNRELLSKPAFFYLENLEKEKLCTLILPATNAKKRKNVKRSKNKITFDLDWLEAYKTNSYDESEERNGYQLISIEYVQNSELKLYIFYTEYSISNQEDFDYLKFARSFIYVFSDKDILEKDVEIFSDWSNLFNLKVRPISSQILNNYYMFGSGRIIGGERYPVYYLDHIERSE